MPWTTEQILAFAPDTDTAKKAQNLALPQKWISVETNGDAIWGRCRGSGSKHYQTIVDLKEPAFKCNCPSRKIPCKHSIGLFLYASSFQEDLYEKTKPPKSINDWLTQRIAKTSKTEKQKTPQEIQKAEARKEKAAQDRMLLMKQGMRDLENWLTDIIRTGMAAVDGSSNEMVSTALYTKNRSAELWRNISMRMVDSKLPGMGRRIREMSLIHGSGKNWPDKLLNELSDLYLFTKSFEKLEQLPDLLQKEILRIVGVVTKKEDVLKQQGIEDQWQVIGQFIGTNIDNATVRRTWFLGEKSKRFALILEYDYNHLGFPIQWSTGRIFQGEMFFYPSISPLRAIMRTPSILEREVEQWNGYHTISDAIKSYSKVTGDNPWIMDYPFTLNNVIPHIDNNILILLDHKGEGIPVLNKELSIWKIMALSGGKPIDIFGEWTGKELNPIAIIANKRYIAL